MTLRPWREIAVPHRDVLEGTFQQSEFAADITAVHTGRATPEYQDAAWAERSLARMDQAKAAGDDIAVEEHFWSLLHASHLSWFCLGEFTGWLRCTR